jgi:hypothetical protein
MRRDAAQDQFSACLPGWNNAAALIAITRLIRDSAVSSGIQ